MPKEKVILAIGSYGYSWQKNEEKGRYEGGGLTFEDVRSILEEKKPKVERSSGVDERGYARGSVPYFTYSDDKGSRTVWYEDAESMMEKVPAVKDIAGVYLWRLGAEDKSFWEKLKKVNF